MQLDGEVGDAGPGIHHPVRDDGVGGAGRTAGAAAAAVLPLEGRVHRQRQVGVELAQEEPGAGPGVEQHGVLADPAEPRLARQGPLHHRRRVDEGAVAEGAHLGLQPLGQGRQALAHQLVVVAAGGVAGDVGGLGPRQGLEGLHLRGQVVQAHADHPDRARHQLLRPGALAAVLGHEAHLAVMAGGQPALQAGLVLGQVDVGDAQLLEAELVGPAAQALGQGMRIGGVVEGGRGGHDRGNTVQGAGATWRRPRRLYTVR